MTVDLGSAYGKIIIDTRDMQDSLTIGGRAMSGIQRAGKIAFAALGVAAAGASAAIVKIGVSSTKVASDFQDQMAILSTAAKSAGVGLETLSDAALAVGGDTDLVGVSASSAADSMTGLFKAGLTTTEIFGNLNGYLNDAAELGGALRASIDLAAASELDMGQASDLAAKLLATFGGEMETEAERAEFINAAMNNMVQTADASVASVSGLADALVNVGPTAAAFGFSLEDTNVALGILSTRGIEGAAAGTALKSMLTNLNRQTDDVVETLDALNVNLYNADGTMQSLPAIISQLTNAMSGMTEEQRNQTVQTLAGTFGMNAMNTLLAEGASGWSDMRTAVSEAATIQEVAAARTNTLSGVWEAFQGVVESLQIKLGNALLPHLQTTVTRLSELAETYGPLVVAFFEQLVTSVTSFIANLQEGMSPLDAFIEAIWDMAPQALLDALVKFRDEILPGITTAFENIYGPVSQAVASFVEMKDVLIAAGIILGVVVVSALASLAAAMAPVTLAILGLIAIVATLRNAWEADFAGIRDFVAGIWTALQESFAAFRSLFEGDFAAFGEHLKASWEASWNALSAFLGNLWSIIQPKLQAFWTAIVQWFSSVDWASLGRTIIDLIAFGLAQYWAAIQPILQRLWESVVAWFSGIDWAQIGRNIVTWISNGLETFLTMIGSTIQGWFNKTEESVRAIDWKQIGYNVVTAVLEGLYDFEQKVQSVLDDWKNAFWNWVLNTDWEELANNLIDSINTGLENFGDTIDSTLQGWWKAFVDWFEGVDWQKLGDDIVAGVSSGITNGVGKIISAVGDLAQGALDAARDFFQTHSPSRLMETEIGANIPAGIARGITGNIGTVLDAFKELADTVEIEGVKKFAKTVEKVVGIIEPAIEAVEALSQFGGVGSLVGPIANLAANLREVLSYFHVLAGEFWEALQPIKEFASAAKAAVDIIEPSIDALSALASYRPISNLPVYIGALAGDLRTVFAYMGVIAGETVDLLNPVTSFAAAVGEVVKIIEPAINALIALGEYVSSSGLKQATAEFATNLSDTIKELGSQFVWMAGISADTLEQARDIFDTIGEVIKVVEPSVEALGLLGSFVAAADLQRKTDLFIQHLSRTIQSLGSGFLWMAQLSAETLSKAVQVFSTIQGVIGVVKPAVEALAALVEYQIDPKELAIAVYKFMGAFVQTVTSLVNGLNRIAAIMTLDAIAAAVTLAEGVIDLTKNVQTAVREFAKIGDIEVPALTSVLDALQLQALEVRKAIFATAVTLAETLQIKMPTTISAMIQAVASGLAPLPIAFQNIGVQSVNALIRSLNAGIPAIRNAAYSAAYSAYLAAMQALQIGSPSKLFSWLADQSVAGFVQSLAAGIPAIQDVAQMTALAAAPIEVSPTPINLSSPINLYGGQNFNTGGESFDIMRALESLT